MSRQIQIRRGTAAEHNDFTGAIGEITMDTTNNTLRVHDGATPGGTVLAKQSDVSNSVSTKLNQDIDNITTAGKNVITGLCMPNYSAGTEVQNTTTTSGSYTAPSNGQFMLYIIASTASTTFKINGTAIGPQKPTTTGGYSINYTAFITAGDSLTWSCSSSVVMRAYFYPMKKI